MFLLDGHTWLPLRRRQNNRAESEELQMKTGRRLLAMLLVLAMLVSNLPVGAIAAEIEDLTAEPTEALTETEQPTEAPVEETEAPETTAAPAETETEAVEETTAEVTEEAVEETTVEVTEEAVEETTEAAETEPVVEPVTAAEEAVNETAAVEELPESGLIFRWLNSDEYDSSGNILYYEPESGSDVTNIDMLPTEPFYLTFYFREWDADAEEWLYTPVLVEELGFDESRITIEAIPETNLLNSGDYGYLAVATPVVSAWDTTSYVTYDGYSMKCWLGRSPGEMYYTDTFNNDTVITRYTIDPDGENVFYYYFDTSKGWTQQSFTQTLGAEYVDVEYLDGEHKIRYTFTEEAVARAAAGEWLHLEFETVVYNEEEGSQTWTTPMWVGAEQTAENAEPYLTFAKVFENENGLYVDTGYYGREFVNPYGSVTQVAFFLNEYVDGQWRSTSVEVEPVDGSISLEPLEGAIEGAEYGYTVTTNTPGVTSGVTCGDVTMNVGTWPNHFHFSADGSTQNTTESLIYELDLDHLSENDSFDVYAVMFHEGDFTWSNVRLSQDSQRFASLYQVSESVYRITISGVARKHVSDDGYVNLEVLSTQTDNNTGDVNEYGYMYLPIFMAPQTSLVMVGLGDNGDGTGYYEDPDYISYQMMFCPGKEWLCVFYLREWDAAAGEMKLCQPVDPALLQVDGDLTFTALDPSEVQEGQENGAYFVRLTTDTFNQNLEVYVELEDGTRAGGVYIYTHRYFVEYYKSEEMSDDTVLTGYYVDPDGENVVYVGFSDADCGGTHRGVPIMDAYFGTVEKTNTYGIYKITLSEELVSNALRGYPQYVQVDFEVDYEDGHYERHGAGLSVTAHEEDYVSYLTYGFLEGSMEGLVEGENHSDTSYTIVPGDAYPHIYYVHTWDSEQGCYVETPVPADELYCDDETFIIAAMPAEDYKAGEDNADCFVWIAAEQWDHESEIYTYVDGVRTEGVRITTYLPHLGFYRSEELSYDTYLHGEFLVDPEAEENAFYVGLVDDYWVIDGDPWLADENMAGLMTLTKVSDKVIKVTLTPDGVAVVTGGDQLWPGIQFNIRNTMDDQIQFRDSGGLCVRANLEDVTPTEDGLYAYWVRHDGNGFYASGDSFCGTNIAKYDEYTMYFYLKLWNEEQGQYVEIPVHPQHDAGIILNRIENVKDGEENGEYFYAVSIADDALDTEQEVWVEHEGTRYAMPITSGLHNVAVYTTEEPSHDTRLTAPVDVEPFGENVVYLVTNGDWEIENVTVHDWADTYLDVECVNDCVYSVTLTKEGINQNMTQWILDMGMDVVIRNVEDPEWTENHDGMSVAFSRENLEILGYFGIDDSSWFVIDGGYYREWFTGEENEEGHDIWDAEVLADLPEGLTYDYGSNTLTMEDYSGNRLTFFREGVPTDTLTIELTGDNSLISEEPNPFSAELMNVVVQGEGSLTVEAINDFYVDSDKNARTFESWYMREGDLTVQGNASLIIEVDGQGNEAVFDEEGNCVGAETGKLRALVMDRGSLFLKDNARLETVLPGLGRDGEEDVGEGYFPGGYEGITGVSHWNISGGTLVTQLIDLNSGYDGDGRFWANTYTQTDGDVTVQAQYWNSYNEENGLPHAHYEGLAVRPGTSASISGGTLNVHVEATDAQLAESTWYEAIGIRGGELTVSGDAEVNVSANHGNGNLIGVYSENDERGRAYTGKLLLNGGVINAEGLLYNESVSEWDDSNKAHVTVIDLTPECSMELNGTTINSTRGRFFLGGTVVMNDGGINGYDTSVYLDGRTVINGGTIDLDAWSLLFANNQVEMNGGKIDLSTTIMQINGGFAFNDGEIVIDSTNEELFLDGFETLCLYVGTYLSIGGSGLENANPILTVKQGMKAPAVCVAGTYHQMGGTVNIIHSNTENPAIYVASNLDENGAPVVRTDWEGNPVLDENGNVVYDVGSFLMNDGILNVENPGDYEADLINAMEADPHSFVQFRGGKTTFDTAQINWNGETHITETAVVEVKDAVILANAGHLVMDDGTLLANDESAVCLGDAEMNGGRMELDNAMLLVNSGFHFNNGEIIINNISTEEAPIDAESIFTSLAANTYFAIGDPENPDSNPRLVINHNLTRCPAVLVNGTMHLMAGSVEITVPVTRAPAIHIEGIQYDEEGNPLKTDRDGHPMGAEFLQNGGVLNIHAAEEDGIAGIIGGEGSVFFMNGGEANLNGTNFVMSGNMVLNDKAVMNINDGILRLYETASLDVNAGQLNMDSKVKYGDDVFAVLQAEAGSAILLRNNGALTIDNEAYRTALELYGELTLDSDAQLNIRTKGPAQEYDENGDWIWRFGVYANESSEITVNGGTVSVEATDVNGAFVTWGEFTQTGGIMNLSNLDESGTYEGENAIETNGPTVISGGVMNLTSTDTGYANNSSEELEGGSRVTISGGTINIDVPRLAMWLCSSTTISGGEVNIHLSNYYQEVPGGTLRYTRGICMYGWENPGASLNITGGMIDVVIDKPEQEYDFYDVDTISVMRADGNITGGVIHVSGGPVFFHTTNAEEHLNLGDMVVYSRSSGKHLEQLYYTVEMEDGTVRYGSGFEEDNIPDDMANFAEDSLAKELVIVTGKAGTSTTWELNDGVLTFQSAEDIGGMYDYSAAVHAPWYWVRDFLTEVEMDTNLGYIGSYAFNGLDRLTKLVFLGEAPNFASDAFAVITADAYYPVETDSWTTEKLQQYGGKIAWLLDYQSVEVVEILTDKDVLFAGEKTKLTADLYPELEETTKVVWTLGEGSEYATLSVKNNVATVTAKNVTEKQVVTVLAVAEKGLAAPVARILTLYPEAKSVDIYRDEDKVTGKKIKFDLNDGDLELTAALNPGDAEEYLVNPVKWSSSSEKIATVDENGVVTFQKAGTVKITATATDGSEEKAAVTVTALDMIQGIEMAEGSREEIVGGKSATFYVVDAYAETPAKLKSSQVKWTMDKEFAPYGSITTAGKLTTKVVQEPVTVTIVATLVDDPEVSVPHMVTICPASALMQVWDEDGQNVTGKTIPVAIDPALYDTENLPTVSLSAIAYPDGALTSVSWKSSSTKIATVDKEGLVTCKKAGTVTITATDANSKKSASVKLNFGVFAEDVTISSAATEIVSGKSLTLTAEVSPANVTKSGVTWSLENASDKNYLSVTSAGKVKAKTVYAPTDVVLVATSKDGRASEKMTLTVLPKDESILVIKSGEEYVTKTTQVLDLNGDPSITLSAWTLESGEQETVTWTPSTSSLGTLVKNEDGSLTVTMTGAGSLTVTAKTSDGRKATVTLKAVKLATGVLVSEKSTDETDGLTLTAGKTMTLKAAAQNASKVKFSWSVEPSGIASITSGGKLTASSTLVYEQKVTVTATANDGSGASGELVVTLKPKAQGIQISSLSGITHPSVELTNCTVVHDMAAEEDRTIQLSAQVFPAEAADDVTWKSSNTKVASIDKDGVVTCKKPGTVTITATAADGSGKKATFKLKLVRLVSELKLNKTEAVLAGGKSLTLKADAGNATDDSVTWSMTGDTAYASLSSKGVLKASAVTAPKTVYVTATAKDGSGKTAGCTVTIYPATSSVRILHDDEVVSGKTLEVQMGQTLVLEGSSLPVSAAHAYTWKSSGSAATVKDGVVTGVTAGKTVTITCTAADGTGKKATVKVKVVPATFTVYVETLDENGGTGSSFTRTFSTSEKYLLDALVEEGFVEGEYETYSDGTNEYTSFRTISVGGYSSEESPIRYQWWCCFDGEEYADISGLKVIPGGYYEFLPYQD